MSGAALVGGVTGAQSTARTHEDRKKQRELDEARKQGLVEPEKDADGNLINPHIPEFMSAAPWYMQQQGPGLQHQKSMTAKQASAWDAKRDKYRDFDEDEFMRITADRYTRSNDLRRQRRKEQRAERNAERRRVKAELRRQRKERMAALRATKRARRAAAAAAGEPVDSESESESESDSSLAEEASDDADDSDEDVRISEVAEAKLTADGVVIPAAKAAVRNLRLREDRAKYLINLDTDSAYYEPGTRSMRDNPNAGDKADKDGFRGDAALLTEGDEVAELARTQLVAWEARNRGQDISLHGNPTAAENLRKTVERRKLALAEARKEGLRQRYGGSGGDAVPDALRDAAPMDMPAPPPRRPRQRAQAHAPPPAPAASGEPVAARSASAPLAALPPPASREVADAIAQRAIAPSGSSSSSSSASRAAGGRSSSSSGGQALPSSRFDEDVLDGSHLKVWGSWYDRAAHSWGYACCRSTSRSTKCTGAAGIAARALAERLRAIKAARASAAPAPAADGKQVAADKAGGAPSWRKSASEAQGSSSQAPAPISRAGDGAPEAVETVPPAAAPPRAALPQPEHEHDADVEPSLAEQTALAVAEGRFVPRPHSARPGPSTSSSMYGGGAGGSGVGGADGDDDSGAGGGYGEEEVRAGGSINLKRMQAALERRQEEEDAGRVRDERSRGFMSDVTGTSAEPTEEEMEAFKLTRQVRADPMANVAEADDDENDEDVDVSAALAATEAARAGSRKRPREEADAEREGGRRARRDDMREQSGRRRSSRGDSSSRHERSRRSTRDR